MVKKKSIENSVSCIIYFLFFFFFPIFKSSWTFNSWKIISVSDQHMNSKQIASFTITCQNASRLSKPVIWYKDNFCTVAYLNAQQQIWLRQQNAS